MGRSVVTRVIFLPSAAEPRHRWLRIEQGTIVARGDGVGAGAEPVAAVAPAEDVALHWAALPGRSLAQAISAARLLVADQTLGGHDDVHVAVGAPAGDSDRPIGVVSASRLRTWLADLAAHGVDPDAVIPAPMLLPVPDDGFVTADLGGDRVVRGHRLGFADEETLTPLLTGGTTPLTLDQPALEAAVAAAVVAPALDLRQGPFARQEAIEINFALVRRAGWLIAAILMVSFLLLLAQLARYSFAASSTERQSAELARTGLAPGETVTDAPRQLTDRLARLRGPGAGFSATAATAFAAVRAVPGSELRAVNFDAQGQMTITVVTQTEGQISDVAARLRAAGFTAEPGPFSGSAGHYQGEIRMVQQ